MNRILLLLLLTLSANLVFSQVNVTLTMKQKLGGHPFFYNTAIESGTGYSYNISRLQYYISEIKLIHDNGLVTPLTDLYFLVDPAVDTTFELGNLPITVLEKIQFSIGVDSAHNHLDPSTYPDGHPLAPQNPTMYWGWTAGYRFIALEGHAGPDSNSLNNTFQIHTIGDVNYRNISMNVTGELISDHLNIDLQAEYAHFLDYIDASGGIISHASTGESKQIADNTRAIFSPFGITGIAEPSILGSFDISPNPSRELRSVSYDFPGHEDISFTILDLNGHTLYSKQLEESKLSFALHTNWPSGIYLASMYSHGKLLAIEKLIVD